MTQHGVVPFYSHECPDCTFALDWTHMTVTPEQLKQATVTFGRLVGMFLRRGYPTDDFIVPIGRYTMPQWNGHNMFWLFPCSTCDQHSVDYLHSYEPYLTCQHCGVPTSVYQDRFYQESGLPLPLTKKEIKEIARELAARYDT